MNARMRLLHRFFLFFNHYLMLPLIERFGGTRDSVLGGRLCVLRTVGRRSGQPRQVPLNYAPTTGGIAIIAGFGRSTGWVHNLRAAPDATVLVGTRIRVVHAVEIEGRDDARRVTRAVLRNAGAMGFYYGWDPRRATEAQLQAVADQLVCFHLRFVEHAEMAVAA